LPASRQKQVVPPPTCAAKFEQQGVKLYAPKVLNEFAKVIAEQEARDKQ
jgi:hypothetical protein